ncbi:hypothetical protein Mmc1_0106 [Magnetococcus marinus MC-1]|uniref:Glycosyltransferase RgtA/B/C/D-like domain-containing protein n=1 Tax=Magnetococcus marinus (strain ATCC BAA-1437 / JCM 17883 / MC-1) TaxID=156889 RepID=A0L3U2_MAGMM|nr:hypothetical protein [Magnetococcus marinus]ABK42635.1 hypothetical protein Mmc1_0106 [Magnetococcus marinus MC-1]
MHGSSPSVSLLRWLPALFLLVLGLVYLWLNLPEWSVKHYPDSNSYLLLEKQTFIEALSHVRTMGYPAFAWALKTLTGSYAAVPVVQYVLHLLAALLLWYGLCVYGLRPWSALVVTLPVLFANIIRYFSHALLSDALGATLVVVVVALLLLYIARPWQWGYGVALAVAVFVAFQVRPANQVLVPMLVLVGGLLYGMRPARLRSDGAMGFWSMLGRLSAAGFVPLLGFFTLRLLLVGHFGLVAATGIPLIGIAGSLITPDLLPQIREEVRPLAQTIVDDREKDGMEVPFSTLGWIRYGEWYRQYDWNNYHNTVLAHARRMHNGNHVMADQSLQQLAVQVLRLRFSYYAKWIMAAAGDALGVLLRRDFNLQLTGLLWLLAVLFYHTLRGMRVWRGKPIVAARDAQAMWEISVVVVVGLLYAGMATLLVILTAPPIERYLQNTAIFLPGVVALLAYIRVQEGWQLWRSS